jgi:3-hydroxyisobutyrate dehydrogenase-like beta-hydroxyacid dehydrogenase
MSDTSPIGIVGLGLVGQALGLRLLGAGFDVLGFDLRAGAREDFVARGGRSADSVAALGAQARTVVLAVFETRDVIDVVEGTPGLLAGGLTRAIIDCSTGDPDALEALAGRLAARGIDFIEAPLSGSSQQIAAGEATALLGGDDDAIERARDVLQALATRRIHLGGAGMGARAKLATNLVIGLNRAALAEGMVFAQRLGIAPAAFLELVLATPARSAAAEVKGGLMVREEFQPQSRIRQHLKDVRLMIDGAAALGQRLPLSQVHADLMQAAVDAGDGDLDNAAIVRQLRREALPRVDDAPSTDSPDTHRHHA